MVFSSGYACNLGTLTALAGREDILFSDALNHACLIDGCRLSRGRVVVYPHNDMQALESLLEQHRSKHRNAFIVTDTVFSMDGDVADVEAIDRLCERYSAIALADEAHATGVLGPFGRGVLAQYDWFAPGQPGRLRWVATGTLSKALGTHGGFVAGPAILEPWLIHHARSWIYSTAMPASVCAAATTAVRLAATMDTQREHLASMSRTLRQRLAELGLSTRVHDTTPIVPVPLGDNHRVVEISQRLLERGVYVPAIRPPTVPRDAAMLRISLNAAHQPEEIDRLLTALRDAITHSPTR
jgi:8-amino-7-oxononanoate synthase